MQVQWRARRSPSGGSCDWRSCLPGRRGLSSGHARAERPGPTPCRVSGGVADPRRTRAPSIDPELEHVCPPPRPATAAAAEPRRASATTPTRPAQPRQGTADGLVLGEREPSRTSATGTAAHGRPAARRSPACGPRSRSAADLTDSTERHGRVQGQAGGARPGASAARGARYPFEVPADRLRHLAGPDARGADVRCAWARRSTTARTRCTLGFHRRLVRRCEWLTFMPKPGFLPQMSHTDAIGGEPS